MGGGKTVILVLIVTILARAFPGSRWAIIRKDLPRLKKNVIPTWNRFAPRSFWGDVNKSDWNCKAVNGSEVLFFPASEEKDPELDRLKGLELSGAFVDECNEMSEGFMDILNMRCGRWPSTPRPPKMILMTCNPTQLWPKKRFYDPWSKGKLREKYFYMPAKVTDNPFLPQEYIEGLEELRETAPYIYKVMVLGDWSVADDPDQLISTQWVEDALVRDPVEGIVLPPRLGVDPARYGDDETVLARTINYHLAEIQAHQHIDTQRAAEFAMALVYQHGIKGPDVRVDTVGVGGGVADAMAKAGVTPEEFIANAVPTSRDWPAEKRGFLNHKSLRGEAWWNIREILRNEQLSVTPDLTRVQQVKLIADLTAPRYSVDGDKVIVVESKPAIKKRLKRSPDYGDALVMAFAELPKKERFFYVSI